MRIRTQFIITMALFGILLVGISASVIITNQRVAASREQENLAHRVALDAGNLSYLSNDYVIYLESQQLSRWQSGFDSFSRDVAALQADRPEEQALVRNIQVNQQRLKEVFDSISAAAVSTNQSQTGTISPEFIQVSWSRVAVQTQGLGTDASHLSQLQSDQAAQLQRVNFIVIFAMIAVFGAYFVVIFFTIQRRTLKSIAALQAGTSVIGSGNLDFRFEEKKNDEIGDLSRAFNRMTSNLQEVTASKADLEKEVTERKKAQAELVASRHFLEIANRNYSIKSLLSEFISYVKEFTGCEAVGIRLIDESGNIPYMAYEGFSPQFFEKESCLSLKTDHGMCINVVKGTTDSKLPFYTELGSFYSNGTTRFLAAVSEDVKGPTRDACNAAGYESVGLIPVKLGTRILGLIHLADRRGDKVPLNMVQQIEEAASALALSIQRAIAEEGLKKAEQNTSRLAEKRRLVHELSLQVVAEKNMEGLLYKVAEAARALTGASLSACGYGYINGHFTFLVSSPAEGRLPLIPDGVSLNESGSVFQELIQNRQSIRLTGEEVRKHPSRLGLPEGRTALRGLLGTSLFNSLGKPNGLVIVCDKPSEEEFTAEDEAFLTQLASITSLAIQHIEARRNIEQKAEELEIANKELESFSYTVSHDLRAPLRSMDGFGQALLEDYSAKLDEQGKQWLNNIRTSSQHMGHLIDDILGLSRVIRAELRAEKVDLSEMAGEVAGKLARSEPGRHAEFIVAPGMEETGDRNLLELVLQNLLGNAFKFTSRRPEARIEFGSVLKDGVKKYYVRDNGAGFDMQYADKLFKPFQRLHSDRDYPGTGIGLVTVQRIIQRHGGEVWAEGEIDRGAAFYFTINQKRKSK